MQIWLILLLTVSPAIIFIFIVYKRDTLKKELKRLIFRAIIAGLIAVIIAFFLELIVELFLPQITNVISYIFVESFLIAALIEEGLKLLGSRIFLWKRKEFNLTTDGIVLFAVIGFSFAAIENILYGITGDLSQILIRDLTAVPAHGLMTGLMGGLVGLKKEKNPSKFPWIALFIGLILHGVYDFFAFSAKFLNPLYFIVVLVIVVLYLVIFIIVFRRSIKSDRKIINNLQDFPS